MKKNTKSSEKLAVAVCECVVSFCSRMSSELLEFRVDFLYLLGRTRWASCWVHLGSLTRWLGVLGFYLSSLLLFLLSTECSCVIFWLNFSAPLPCFCFMNPSPPRVQLLVFISYRWEVPGDEPLQFSALALACGLTWLEYWADVQLTWSTVGLIGVWFGTLGDILPRPLRLLSHHFFRAWIHLYTGYWVSSGRLLRWDQPSKKLVNMKD